MPFEAEDQLPATLREQLAMTRDMPWKARNELGRMLLMPWARLQLVLGGVQWQPGWRLYGLPIIQKHRRSELRIGAQLTLRSSIQSNPLGPNHPCILTTRRAKARLIIGGQFGMTGGAVVCEDSITIGHRVIVGCNSVITDTDFHPLGLAAREAHPLAGLSAPVIIEDDVFIGMQALILKGVRLGAGCVIAAGSVVTRDVPPGAVAAGVPAQVIRQAGEQA